MASKLEGKVIVVAGAGGIGAGVASYLADEGATVVVGDISHYAAAEIVEEIVAEGGKAVATHLDGADDASAKEIIPSTMALRTSWDTP